MLMHVQPVRERISLPKKEKLFAFDVPFHECMCVWYVLMCVLLHYLATVSGGIVVR